MAYTNGIGVVKCVEKGIQSGFDDIRRRLARVEHSVLGLKRDANGDTRAPEPSAPAPRARVNLRRMLIHLSLTK